MCPLLCHPARGNKARLIQGESELQYSFVITLTVTTWCARYLVVLGNWKRARSFKTILGRWLEESSVYYRLTSTNQPEEPVGSPKLSPKPVEEKKRAHSEEPLMQFFALNSMKNILQFSCNWCQSSISSLVGNYHCYFCFSPSVLTFAPPS